jgi:hypothetical protein
MVDINDLAPIAHKASEDRAKLKAATTPGITSPKAVQATSSKGPKAVDQGEVKTPKGMSS